MQKLSTSTHPQAAQPQDISTISVKLGHDHSKLTQVLHLKVSCNQDKSSAYKTQFAQVFGKEMTQSSLVIKTQIRGDYEQIVSKYKKYAGVNNISYTRSQNNLYFLVTFGPNQYLEKINGTNQQQPFLTASIKTSNPNPSVEEDTLGFFQNATFDLVFKKTQAVVGLIEDVLNDFGTPEFSNTFLKVYNLFKQINLQLNFNSLSSLPAAYSNLIKKMFQTPISEKGKEFNLEQIGESATMVMLEGKAVVFEFELKTRFAALFTSTAQFLNVKL